MVNDSLSMKILFVDGDSSVVAEVVSGKKSNVRRWAREVFPTEMSPSSMRFYGSAIVI